MIIKGIHILSVHDLAGSFKAVKIGQQICEIAEQFTRCTGIAWTNHEGHTIPAKEDLVDKASRHSANANAIIVTLTKEQGKEVTGCPVYIPALDTYNKAVS